MTQTFTALLFAHVLADFVFQTGWIAAQKKVRHPGALALHILIVGATAAVTLGSFAWLPMTVLVAAHIGIDLLKTLAPKEKLWPYLADQGAHLVSLAVIAAWQPGLWAAGVWSGAVWVLPLMATLAGLLFATRAGSFAIGLLMTPWAAEAPDGLPDGGKLIGLLERGLIFVLVLVGLPAGIGFLIAAKSILRFDTHSSRVGEYVIIGTLASFGWAVIVAYATNALIAVLPPLEIGALTP